MRGKEARWATGVLAAALLAALWGVRVARFPARPHGREHPPRVTIQPGAVTTASVDVPVRGRRPLRAPAGRAPSAADPSGEVRRLVAGDTPEDIEDAIRNLSALGERAVPALHDALEGGGDQDALARVGRALAAIGTEHSVGLFLDFLMRPENDRLCGRLAPSLLAVESAEAGPPALRALLASTNFWVSMHTAQCLQRVSDAAVVQSMLTAYDDRGSDELRRTNLRGVIEGVRDPGAVPLLAKALLSHPDESLREAAARGLATVGNAEASAALVEAVEQSGAKDISNYLVQALVSPKDQDALDFLQEIWRTTTNDTVRYAVSAALAATQSDWERPPMPDAVTSGGADANP